MRFRWISALPLLAMLAACGEKAEQDSQPIEVVGGNAQLPAGPAPQEVRGQDFASAVLGSLDFSLASARAAAERSERPATKAFAQTLVTGFSAARQELADTAAAAGLKATPAAGATDQSDLAILLSTRGAALETVFAEQQVERLTQLLGTVRAYKNGGDNPALRAWAEKHQGTITDRLLDLQMLKAELEEATPNP